MNSHASLLVMKKKKGAILCSTEAELKLVLVTQLLLSVLEEGFHVFPNREILVIVKTGIVGDALTITPTVYIVES